MKITDIKATTVTVPLEAPLRHAAGCHWGRFVRTIVEVETDEGIIGLGEMGGGGEDLLIAGSVAFDQNAWNLGGYDEIHRRWRRTDLTYEQRFADVLAHAPPALSTDPTERLMHELLACPVEMRRAALSPTDSLAPPCSFR